MSYLYNFMDLLVSRISRIQNLTVEILVTTADSHTHPMQDRKVMESR